MHILTTDLVKTIIHTYGVPELLRKIQIQLLEDYKNWEIFTCSSRFAHYIDEGVIELMPIGNADYFSFKYVNGHPGNVAKGYPSIMAVGQLSDCHTGMPLFLSEMTILTALRTAATTRIAAIYGAHKNSSHVTIIGNGSQSIFQTIAICEVFPITCIHYYDIDETAMDTFSSHIEKLYPHIQLHRMKSSHDTVILSDIIITVTEAFGHQALLSIQDIKPGAFIAGVGGDCPGKTELDISILESADIIVEYEEQTRKEGEIQKAPHKDIYATLSEIIQGKIEARRNNESIVLFDSVGFALEDYSVLQVFYQIVQGISGDHISLVPENMVNLKDLYGFICKK